VNEPTPSGDGGRAVKDEGEIAMSEKEERLYAARYKAQTGGGEPEDYLDEQDLAHDADPYGKGRRSKNLIESPFGPWAYLYKNGDPWVLIRRFDVYDEVGHKVCLPYAWDPERKDWAKKAGMPKGPRILLHLPQLYAAPNESVWFVEGEKKAEMAMKRLGLIATTAIQGAGNSTPEAMEALRGRTVFIVPDNNNKGRMHAIKVATQLHGIAKEVRIVELPRLEADEDLEQWLEDHGGSKDELLKLAAEAPVFDATALNEWDDGDDDDSIPPRGWLLGNVFCRRFPSSLIGDGGTGKSALRYAQALSLATGRSLTGEHVFQRCRVLIVSLEDDRDELRRRIRAAKMHYGISHSDTKGWLFLAAPGREAGKLLKADPKGGVVDGGLANKLRATIHKRHLDIIILDPFVKTHSVEENDNSRMDEVIQILSGLAAEEDIAVDFPHHTSKGRAAAPGDADRGRGATAVKDGARLVYTLTTMTTDEAKLFKVEEGDRRLFFRIDPGKVNITPPARDAMWFRLVSVPLGNSSERYPHGDNVQTVERWTPPETFAGLTDDVMDRILDEIAAGLSDGNYYTDAPNATARAAWGVVQKHTEGKTEAQCREVIKAWVKSGVLVAFDYQNPKTWKDVKGLKVDEAKKPQEEM
jgi:hypothetical protein